MKSFWLLKCELKKCLPLYWWEAGYHPPPSRCPAAPLSPGQPGTRWIHYLKFFNLLYYLALPFSVKIMQQRLSPWSSGSSFSTGSDIQENKGDLMSSSGWRPIVLSKLVRSMWKTRLRSWVKNESWPTGLLNLVRLWWESMSWSRVKCEVWPWRLTYRHLYPGEVKMRDMVMVRGERLWLTYRTL